MSQSLKRKERERVKRQRGVRVELRHRRHVNQAIPQRGAKVGLRRRRLRRQVMTLQRQSRSLSASSARQVNGTAAARRSRATSPSARQESGTAVMSKSRTASVSDSPQAATIAAAPQDAPRSVIAPCPRPGCNGQLVEGKRGYGCLGFREGCSFVIWKEQDNKLVTAAMAKAIAANGGTRKLSFKSEDGSSLSGKLILTDAAKGTIEFVPSE